jgi:O-antigen/teichoic acid export membrane protein
MNLRDSSLKPTLTLTAGRTLAFTGTFLIPVVLVRVFDQATFGTYKQLFLVYSTLLAIAQCGMAESLFYFLPRSPRDGGRYVANSLLALSVAGLLGLGLLHAAGPALARLLGNADLASYTTLLGSYLALTLASSGLEIVLISRGRYLPAAFAYGGSDLLRAAFLIVPAVVTARLDWVLVGALGFACFRLLSVLFAFVREFGAELRPDREALRAQLAYALPFAAAIVVHVSQEYYHQYAVSYAFDAATFAIYAVGCLNLPFIEFFAGPAGNLMMVGIGTALREGRPREAVDAWRETTRRLAVVFLPMTGLLVVAAPELITLLFTEAYLPAVPVFMLWSTGILGQLLLTDCVLRAYADTRFMVQLYAVRLALNVVLMAPLIAAFGLPGAVLATLLATAAAKALALARIRRLMRTSLAELLPWGSLGSTACAAAAAALAALVLKPHLPAGPLGSLVGVSLVYLVVLLPVLVRFELPQRTENPCAASPES